MLWKQSWTASAPNVFRRLYKYFQVFKMIHLIHAGLMATELALHEQGIVQCLWVLDSVSMPQRSSDSAVTPTLLLQHCSRAAFFALSDNTLTSSALINSQNVKIKFRWNLEPMNHYYICIKVLLPCRLSSADSNFCLKSEILTNYLQLCSPNTSV